MRTYILIALGIFLFLLIGGAVLFGTMNQGTPNNKTRNGPVLSKAAKKRREALSEKMDYIAKEESESLSGAAPSLDMKLRHIGVAMPGFRLMLFCITYMFLFALLFDMPLLPRVIISSAVTIGLPLSVINSFYNNKMSKFNDQFIDALEIIIRGVRSGLPVQECYKIIVDQCDDPLRLEFATLMADIRVGLPMDQALTKLRQRVPLQSVSFYATAMTVQMRTGGNLSEILQGLVNLLRGKKEMRGKIKSISSQTKASSAILISIPFALTALLSITSPEHIQPLLYTEKGHNLCYVIAIMMSIGIGIIRSMCNFIKDD